MSHDARTPETPEEEAMENEGGYIFESTSKDEEDSTEEEADEILEAHALYEARLHLDPHHNADSGILYKINMNLR